jgi:hypothetical protein
VSSKGFDGKSVSLEPRSASVLRAILAGLATSAGLLLGPSPLSSFWPNTYESHSKILLVTRANSLVRSDFDDASF